SNACSRFRPMAASLPVNGSKAPTVIAFGSCALSAGPQPSAVGAQPSSRQSTRPCDDPITQTRTVAIGDSLRARCRVPTRLVRAQDVLVVYLDGETPTRTSRA